MDGLSRGEPAPRGMGGQSRSQMSRILSLCKRSVSLLGRNDHRLQDTYRLRDWNRADTSEVMPEASRVSSGSHLNVYCINALLSLWKIRPIRRSISQSWTGRGHKIAFRPM